jgi:hypothetical protein
MHKAFLKLDLTCRPMIGRAAWKCSDACATAHGVRLTWVLLASSQCSGCRHDTCQCLGIPNFAVKYSSHCLSFSTSLTEPLTTANSRRQVCLSESSFLFAVRHPTVARYVAADCHDLIPWQIMDVGGGGSSVDFARVERVVLAARSVGARNQ